MDGIENTVENDIDNSIANKRDPKDGSGRKRKREGDDEDTNEIKKREERMDLLSELGFVLDLINVFRSRSKWKNS